jgi:hypothetical protein
VHLSSLIIWERKVRIKKNWKGFYALILKKIYSKFSSDLYCAKVTNLGKSIAAFPVLPRYGKMLALSQQHNLIAYTVCMVAALSVQELLIEIFGADGNMKKWTQIRRFWAGTGNSHLLGM